MNKMQKTFCKFLVLLLLVTIVFWSTTNHARAAGCSTSTPVTTSGSCDVTLAGAVDAGILTMATLPAAVLLSPLNGSGHLQLTGTNQTATFKITTTIIDARGGTTGWKLQANSAGINFGATTAPVLLTQLDNTSICASICSPVLTSLTFTPVTLTTTPQTFLSTGNPGTTVDTGNYALNVDGSFTIPSNAPVGAFTGTVTMTLSSTY